MIVTSREDISANENSPVRNRDQAQPIPADDIRLSNSDYDENGMTRDDIFNQLEDEDQVVTGGRGSRLPLTDSDGGTSPTGYSAGIGSGSGAD